VPSVVSAVKSGAVSPSRIAMVFLLEMMKIRRCGL
jgi:hypothetical protein